MRLSHIEHRLEQQLTLKELIVHSFDNLVKVGQANVTPARLQARLSSLKDSWEKFSIIHDAISLSIKQITQEEQSQLLQHSYFSDNIFSATYESYLDSMEKMNSFFELDSESYNETPSVQTISQNSSAPLYFHHARLPRIDIPKFNGSPSDWLSFKDLFSSLILANPTLSPVEKLQYLKTSVIGSASHLLKNTALTADNFQKSWEALISFYENKRLLVNAALHSLLSLKRMTKESAHELEQLYTSIMQIYRTFETLKRPINKWDDFLVFIAVQRLDPDSVKAWEHHLGSSKEPPTWSQFNEFITTRLLSLQAFEKSRMGKASASTHQNTAKSHFQGKMKDTHSNKPSSCLLCSSHHYIANCPQYSSKTIQQRLALINKNKLCFNCLGSHKVSACRITKRCLKCGHKHHTTIHQGTNSKTTATNVNSAGSTAENSKSTGSKQTENHVLHSSINQRSISSTVLLATAQILVVGPNNDIVKARALIDQGSEVSLISEHLVQLLHLPRSHSSISLIGIGGKKANATKGSTQFTIRSHFNTNAEVCVSAHILSKLTSLLPSVNIQKQSWPHLKGLILADSNFSNPGPIDIILGADVYSQIIEEGIVKGDSHSPIAQRTKLGWIISGSTNINSVSSQFQGYHISADTELHDLLQRFWKLEEVSTSVTSSLSNDDQDCEQHYQLTHLRDHQGRYIVRLPFKQSTTKLGNSRSRALRMIMNLSKKFINDSKYEHAYSTFLDEYEKLGHMYRVPESQPEPDSVYYLPHHGVIRESSLTTKLRVVFNGSSRTDTGYSLNDLLHTGAKLQIDVFDVLIWFRQFRYVFSTDIEKMYRQIKVHEDDWKFQRILWINQDKKVVTYELSTVTYGLACAPFLALRTLNQLIEDEGQKFPLAIPSLTRGRYVDDIFGGADSTQQAQNIVEQLNSLCTAGGFLLQKWISNHPSILQSISPERRADSASIQLEDSSMIHILGLNWNPSIDILQFSVTSSTQTVTTKRTILSTIAKVFDPLGLLAPIIISAKIFMQELWSIKLGWDDPLPPSALQKWTRFLQQLQDIPKLTFPRWINLQSDFKVEIHGFCDASQHAVCAAVYIRSSNQREEIMTQLICAKTKVAPLKRLSIPRLELLGAVLLTNLVSQVLKILNLTQFPLVLWTDSAVVYTWINNHPSKWKDFVRNRVCHIHEILPQAIWKFIPGIDNPADCATRGLTPNQLLKNTTWWSGPHWLSQHPSTWPQKSHTVSSKENLEEKTSKTFTTRVKSIQLWDLIFKYSSFTRLLRITALCMKAISRFRKSQDFTNSITTQDLEAARMYWIKSVQHASFSQEIKTLSKGHILSRSNSLLRLTPFLDSNGLLRLGGRLQSSFLNSNAKHPLIVPKDSPLTSLIISDAHQRTMHGGTQATLSYIRNNYWIVGGRMPVRSFILKCIPCARYRQNRAQQIIGQLPPERVTPSRPFLNTGVDYAGPLQIKNWRGRNSRTYKAYIALFVCFSTSAIHIELVTDYTTDAFIAAYKRFVSRRGICATLISDCGTNFKGANSELQALFSASSKESEKIASLLANDGTQWKFNPPSAPHFGGKWEAGVKSVKYHIKRVIGNQLLTYEEMVTFLTQVEAVLNSRPLCPLTNDPDDLNVLTPAHFLIGSTLSIIPEPSLEMTKVSRLSRWQLTRQMLESFWSHWSKECLQRYLSVYKWNRESPPLIEGTIVLVVDERYPPAKWPLGRVIKSHPGKDYKVRVVTVRTQLSTLKRPITKLCPLPI